MSKTDTERARTVLASSAWLQGHGEDLAEPLLRHGRLAWLRSGQWAHAEGDDDTGLLVVVQGAIQLFHQAPGDRELLLGQAGPGAAMGQAVGFGGGPRLLTVICVEDSLLLQVSDRALVQIAASRPQIWAAVAALQYVQLRSLLEMLSHAAILPPRQRLAARLEQLGRASGDGLVIRLSQQTLAEMVNVTRKTVNAYLAEFEREGLVTRGYGVVVVVDPDGLRRLAER